MRQSSDRFDVNESTLVSTKAKANSSIRQGKKRIITSTLDIASRMETGAALANQDTSGLYKFATVGLNSEHFWIGVPPVFGGPHTFLMSHSSLLI